MKYRYIFLLVLCLVQWVGCQNQALTKYDIVIKEQTISVEIAATEEARAKGLMGRLSLSPDSGMLFVFREEQHVSFWMKDTLLPLSIAFIKSDGTISQIRLMQPLSEEAIRSSKPVKYALETNQGWFERNNIKKGDKIYIPVEIRNIKAE